MSCARRVLTGRRSQLVGNLFFDFLGNILDDFTTSFDVFANAFHCVAGRNERNVGHGQKGNQNFLHGTLSFLSKHIMITRPLWPGKTKFGGLPTRDKSHVQKGQTLNTCSLSSRLPAKGPA